jgi:hypothetical protein
MSKLRSLLPPTLCLALTTCSWTTYFAVINGHSEPIRASYLARPLRTPPMMTVTKDLSEGRQAWQALNVSAARQDSAALTMVIGPDSALVLAELGTYTGHAEGVTDWFEIKNLKILTPVGERSYKDGEVLRAFERRSDRLYVLELR